MSDRRLDPSDPEHDEPKLPRVAGSEARMIQAARALVGADNQRYLPMLRQRQKFGDRIGPTAMALVEQTLARGVTQQLLRRGGWQTRRTLVVEPGKEPRLVRGRLWERHRSLPPLRFGPASFALLAWLVREDVVKPNQELRRHPNTTIADDLLHYFAIEHLQRVGGRPREHAAFRLSPLVQLGYPDELARDSSGGDSDAASTGSLAPLELDDMVGAHAFVLEALQPELARRWIEMERSKGTIDSLDAMIRLGSAQRSVLERLFAAIERARPARRELASFVVEAGEVLLRRGPDRRWWTASLDTRAPLAARQRAFAAAAATLTALARLGRWVEDAGLVAHFEDDYPAAQMLLTNWQFMRRRPAASEFDRGDPRSRETSEQPSGFERAAALARELESLHSLGA
ncbi:hypothetical protein ACNOYE_30550 [Nannocystaceae bacterium ST9]